MTKYGKNKQIYTDAHSWLLGFQLIKWSFCKPIDRYSRRFSIKGASAEAAYSELMRKVLIKLAICSIAFISGKIALFCCWYYHCCYLLLLWVSLKQFQQFQQFQLFQQFPLYSSMFIPGLHSASWDILGMHSWMPAMLAYENIFLEIYVCIEYNYIFSFALDLAMLPKHNLPFQAFNMFWSMWRAQESGLPCITFVPFALIFGHPLGPCLLCKTFAWNFIIENR